MRFETICASQFLVSRLDYAEIVRDIRDEGDIILVDLHNGQKIMLLLVERIMNLSEIRHYFKSNTPKGIHTLFLLWVDMLLPHDGSVYILNNWMSTLVSLHRGKIYGYEVAGRDAFFFPVYMQGKTLKRKVRFGNIINYAAIGGKRLNTLNPYLPGEWLVGNFEQSEQKYRQHNTRQTIVNTNKIWSYYDVLGLAYDADAETVKRAYRILARLYHPDLNTNVDSDERMKQINDAYQQITEHLEG
jgi:DnaJ-like protein